MNYHSVYAADAIQLRALRELKTRAVFFNPSVTHVTAPLSLRAEEQKYTPARNMFLCSYVLIHLPYVYACFLRQKDIKAYIKRAKHGSQAPQGARMNNPVRAYERNEWRSAGYRHHPRTIV